VYFCKDLKINLFYVLYITSPSFKINPLLRIDDYIENKNHGIKKIFVSYIFLKASTSKYLLVLISITFAT
jgi:hypothetical protein